MDVTGDDLHLNELCMGRNRRWTLNGIDLTCGSHFQVRIAGHWIDVVVEYDGKGYYAIPYAVRLYAGLPARFISEWAE
jgi:hypothetical protein